MYKTTPRAFFQINTVNSKLSSIASSIYKIKHNIEKCYQLKREKKADVFIQYRLGCKSHSKTTNPKNTTYWIQTSKRVKYIFPKCVSKYSDALEPSV